MQQNSIWCFMLYIKLYYDFSNNSYFDYFAVRNDYKLYLGLEMKQGANIWQLIWFICELYNPSFYNRVALMMLTARPMSHDPLNQLLKIFFSLIGRVNTFHFLSLAMLLGLDFTRFARKTVGRPPKISQIWRLPDQLFAYFNFYLQFRFLFIK